MTEPPQDSTGRPLITHERRVSDCDLLAGAVALLALAIGITSSVLCRVGPGNPPISPTPLATVVVVTTTATLGPTMVAPASATATAVVRPTIGPLGSGGLLGR